MKKTTKLVWALLLINIVVACKHAENENSIEEVYSQESAPSDSTSVISSSAAVEPKNSNRKFVRSADIKFRVKNVVKSTTLIEDATTKFGGFVTYTNLQSNINNEEKTKVSPDSTLVTTKYSVENNITIRVPNTKLDTILKTIAKQIDFLNYRVINADDVTLQILSNKMAQKRSASVEKRFSSAIEKKGKKLDDVIKAEENLNNKKEANDSKKIENLSLEDQVNLSTITLLIYQDNSIKQEMIANEKNINAYRQNIGLQIWDSIKSGWFIFENIISFVFILWPIVAIGLLAYLGYKKYKINNNN